MEVYSAVKMMTDEILKRIETGEYVERLLTCKSWGTGHTVKRAEGC